MKEELELKLQEDFPFMKQNKVKDEHHLYKRWGCQCSAGWYQLINDLCQAITVRYAEDGREIDIVIDQVKEKFASLRFYYSYVDATCLIHAFDSMGDGTSLRFQPKDVGNDEAKNKLRHDIAQIVRGYEEKSKTICEYCGQAGSPRMDMTWKKTLCDSCYDKHRQQIEAKKAERSMVT